MKHTLSFLLAGLLLAGLCSCGTRPTQINSDWRPNDLKTDLTSTSLQVKRVENLPDNFIFGIEKQTVYRVIRQSSIVY